MSAMASLKRLSGNAAEPQQEPDEDLVGATAEDNIAELINHICEEVMLFANNAVLSKICPFILEICKYPAKYKNESLQQAATLALIRFMTVSSKFCEAHMPFLMNILNYTKNIKIKCNIVIGLSDLTFRFPNIIEPWTGHLYSTLHEENTEIRLTAVKMLSHLILHEMIRVKGQIADMAMCIVDPNNEIKNITMQFFKEISHKSNILYNVLPDIISKLSDTSLNLDEDKYRIIMRYILGLICKSRHIETLVEKLCLRFPVTREERQWRDIAYCLSLLKYKEKSIKKLIDNVQYYKDKVQVDEVYQLFKSIISNTGKGAKGELKTLVEELDARINECLEVKDGEEVNITSSTQKKRAPKQGGRKGRSGQGGRRNRRQNTSTDESATSESEDKSPKKTTKKAARRQDTSSSDADSDASTNEADAPVSNKAAMAKKVSRSNARNRVIQETGSSEEERQVPQRKRGRNSNK